MQGKAQNPRPNRHKLARAKVCTHVSHTTPLHQTLCDTACHASSQLTAPTAKVVTPCMVCDTSVQPVRWQVANGTMAYATLPLAACPLLAE